MKKNLLKIIMILGLLLYTGAALAQSETYYYFTQSTGKRKGEIVLGHVQSAPCDWEDTQNTKYLNGLKQIIKTG